ncbi:MAG: NAD(+) kinase [Gammaproteobacteria bacterium]|nr:NAD(+) kinase [Gammaproteobacteria bacterium]
MSFKTIGVIVKPHTELVRDKLEHLLGFLKNKDCEILLDNSVDGLLDVDSHFVTRDELGNRCDIVIALGGDGTMLNAARSLADKDVPLIGINIGRLGFLADISPNQIDTVLDDILSGKHIKEKRFLLEANVVRNEEVIFSADALNDVVIHVRDVARMIEFETRINGQFVNHQRADGLIVSTPTGSTAYALSSGGPILQSDLDAITLVPICPHTLSSRPLVVDSSAEVNILISETKQAIAQLTCDGQTSFNVDIGDHIIIKRKQHRITLLHPQGHNNFDILRAKLRWSE